MTVSMFFKLYAVAFATFIVVDLLWLGVIARGFYQTQLGHLMRSNVNWAAAISFYLIFVAGIVLLVVWPALERQSFAQLLLLGKRELRREIQSTDAEREHVVHPERAAEKRDLAEALEASPRRD